MKQTCSPITAEPTPTLLLHETSSTVIVQASGHDQAKREYQQHVGTRAEVTNVNNNKIMAAAMYGQYCPMRAKELIELAYKKAGRRAVNLDLEDPAQIVVKNAINTATEELAIVEIENSIYGLLKDLPTTIDKEVTFHLTQQFIIFNRCGEIHTDLRLIWGIAVDFWNKSISQPKVKMFREAAGIGDPVIDLFMQPSNLADIWSCAELLGSEVDIPSNVSQFLFSEKAAGILFHETVGHALEQDCLTGFMDKFNLNERFFPSFLSVTDSPTHSSLFGSRNRDDTGALSRDQPLVDNGYIVGAFINPGLADYKGVSPSYNLWRQDFRYPATSRMSNLIIDGGSASFGELMADILFGCYINRISEGKLDTHSGEFHIVIQEAYLIRGGKKAELLHPFALTGNAASIWKGVISLSNTPKASSMYCSTSGATCPTGHESPGCLLTGLSIHALSSGERHATS